MGWERFSPEIVQMMKDLGANEYDLIMDNAAKEGYINIVKMMLESGATDYNSALVNAELKGYKDIIDLIKSYM